jgi:hypothetical protein
MRGNNYWKKQAGFLLFICITALIVSLIQEAMSSEVNLHPWNKQIWQAIAKIESNCGEYIHGDKDYKGTHQARGVFQVQLATARHLGFTGKIKELDDPFVSWYYADKYIYILYQKYNGDIYKTLYAYNAGPGRANDLERRKGFDFKKTKYVKKIISIIKKDEHCKNMFY